MSDLFGGRVVGIDLRKSDKAVDVMQNLFNSAEEMFVDEKSSTLSSSGQLSELSQDDRNALRKIKADMKKLGLKNVEEYFDYLDTFDKQKIKDDLDMT